MKRYVTILLLVCITAVLFVGCGDDQTQPSTSPTTTTESTATTTEPTTATETNTTAAPVRGEGNLSMPDVVYLIQSTGSTRDDIVSYVKPHDDHTLCYGFEGEPSEETLVALDDAQIERLNSLYASIEDFSGQTVAGDHFTVVMEKDGEKHTFSYLCANDDKVNEYVNILFEYCGGDIVPWEVVLRLRQE